METTKGEIDDTSHIVMGLLDYFKGFQCLHDAKEKIEIKCAIEKNLKFWKIEKIKQAWDGANKITNKSDKKHWAYVIMLQMMAHLQNKCAGGAAQNSQTCESHSSEHNQIESIGAESGAQHSTFNETDEVSENPSKEKLQKDDGTGEIRSEESNSGTVYYIKIPLSDLSDGELKQAAHVKSDYKFIEGYPSNRPNTEIRRKTHYVMSYNKGTKNAEWVYEILNESTLAKNHIGINLGKFMQIDQQGHQQDLQQGHLAAAANHSWCQEAYNSTFCFSNILPQLEILNTGLWKTLEKVCRKKFDKNKHTPEPKILNVHVYTGLTGDDSDSSCDEERTINTKVKHNVQQNITKKKKNSDGSSENVKKVPTRFFKVIIVEKDDGTVEKPECYLLPNDKRKISFFNHFKIDEQLENQEILDTKFMARLERIEELSGLKFTAEACRNGETDGIKTMTWEGEGKNGELTTAEINVRISTPNIDAYI